MNRFFSIGLTVLIIVSVILSWMIFSGGTDFPEKKKYLYVYTGKSNRTEVMNFVKENHLVKHPRLFEIFASELGVWKRLKPGRYEINNGESLLEISRMLRNNQQSPVNLVITKLRTNEDIAKTIGKYFEADSTQVINFINTPDSAKQLGVNENTFMSIIIPNTYNFYWNTSPSKIFKKLKIEKDNFWEKNNRLEKAGTIGLTPVQVYTIASIVEEETNKDDEKGMIASVYLNRYKRGMPLGADPTIKFSLKDFGLKRIYEKYLQVESPYNTYKNKGLPPGPICSPSTASINAVLDAPSTDYLFFVAKSDFSGYHTFSINYAEHLQHAKEYQQALDVMTAQKQNGSTN